MLRSRVASCLTATAIAVSMAIAVASPGSVAYGTPATYDQEASAGISGTVADSEGRVVANVKIKVINDSRGLQRETTTNDEGYFDVPFLPPGVYTLTAEVPGFATCSITGLVARSSLNASVAIILHPGRLKEIVRVSAGNNRIDAGDATLKYSVTGEQVQHTPVIGSRTGRALLDTFPLFVPGASPGVEPGSRGEGLIINGGRPLANVFTLDGGDNNDYELGKAASPLPNPDALQEITVVTNNFKADLGGGSGGVINAATKSGSNQLHGNVRYFLSDPALDARSFFAQTKFGESLNTLGAQLGGPIIKNRAHFFFDYEGNSTGSVFRLVTAVPTAAQRVGDFSNLPAMRPPPCKECPQQPIDPLTGQPFPNGMIPADRISPISRLYFDRFIPKANLGADRFEENRQVTDRTGQYTARIDQIIGGADSLSVTYFNNGLRSGSDKGPFPVGTVTVATRDQNLVLRETHVFSARTVNLLSGSLTRSSHRQTTDSPGFSGVHPREAGFTGIQPQTDRFLSLPSIFIFSRFFYLQLADGLSAFPDGAKTTLTVRDDLTQARSTHTLGFGGGVRTLVFDRFLQNNNGEFRFLDSESGLAIADFLLGLPYSYVQNTGNTQYQRQRAYSLYVMDDWRLRPNLTINLGLRYELTPPVTDKLDQVSVYRPGRESVRFPKAPTGQLFVGDPDPVLGTVPRGGYATDVNDFAPRLGVAYSPSPKSRWLRPVFGDGKSSIRAGFGMFYAATPGFHLSGFSDAPPFNRQLFVDVAANGTFARPFGSGPNPFPIGPDGYSFASPSELHTFDPTFHTGYTYHYNLTIQRELPRAMLLEMGYVGNNSFKTNRERDLTPFDPRVVAPFPRDFSSLTWQESSGRARYDSFQLRLSRRSAGGLSFDGSYVFSKSVDDASGPRVVENLLGFIPGTGDDVRPDLADPFSWARSSFDRRHNFVVSYTYSVPALHASGIAGLLLNGWQIGGVTQLRSGIPMEILDVGNQNVRFRRPDFVGPYHRLDPREEHTFVIAGIPVTGHFFFDPRAFQRSRSTGNGTLGRNVFDGPGINLTSLSLAKRIRIRDSHEVELRADISNAFNHVNFAEPGTVTSFRSFGEVEDTKPPRRIQLSVRYRF